MILVKFSCPFFHFSYWNALSFSLLSWTDGQPTKTPLANPSFLSKATNRLHSIKSGKINRAMKKANGLLRLQTQVTEGHAVASAVMSRVAADPYCKLISWNAAGFHASCCNKSDKLSCLQNETDIYLLASVIWCWSNFRKLSSSNEGTAVVVCWKGIYKHI